MRTLYNLSILILILSFALIYLGAEVNMHNHQLACSQWPLCYQQAAKPLTWNLILEVSHRLLASIVGLLTLILAVKATKLRSAHPLIWKKSLQACLVLFLQAILGAIVVSYGLPTLVSLNHLLLSLIFISQLVSLIFLIKNSEKTSQKALSRDLFSPYLTDFYSLLIGLSVIAVFLEGLVQRTGAMGACASGHLFYCLEIHSGALSLWPESNAAQTHMLMRWFQFLFITWGAITFFKSFLFYRKTREINQLMGSWFKYLFSLLALLLVLFSFVKYQSFYRGEFRSLYAVGFLLTGVIFVVSLWIKNILSLKEQLGESSSRHTFLRDIWELMKPRLSALVVSTSLVGMLVAPGSVSFTKGFLAIILIAILVMGACVLNCVIEIDTDKLMLRTSDRSLPAGRISPFIATFIGASMVFGSLILQVIYINVATMILSVIATVFYLFLYTPLKKKSLVSLYVGAVSGAIPPMMGYSIVTGEFWSGLAISLFGILFIWQIPHFLAISLYHQEDYDRADIKIMPTVYGVRVTLDFIFWGTLVLVLMSLVPALLGRASETYARSALLLGFLFSLLAIFSRYLSDTENVKRWGRRYFIGSIIYLPLILAALIFFQ